MNSMKGLLCGFGKTVIILAIQAFFNPTNIALAAGSQDAQRNISDCSRLGAHCWYIILTEGEQPNRVMYLADLKGRGWRVNDGKEDEKSPVRSIRVIQAFESATRNNPLYNVYSLENECLKTTTRTNKIERFWPENRIEVHAGDNSWDKPSALWVGRAAIFSCVRNIQNHLNEASIIHAVDTYRPADVVRIMRTVLWKGTSTP